MRSTNLALMVSLAQLLLCPDANAAPRWLRVSWTDTESADTTMTVSWNDSDAGGGTIAWREHGATTETTIDVASVDTGSSLLEYVYEGTIADLAPYTVYDYRVLSGGAWSDWKMFRTAPVIYGCQPMVMAVGGDGRGGEEFWDPGYVSRHWDDIAAQMLADIPVAVLYGGDIVHVGSEDAQWEEWFTVSELLTAYVPVLPAIGNHDVGPGEGDSQWYDRMFALPRGGAGSLSGTVDPDGNGVEDMWAIVVGNVLLVTLSTEGIDVDVQHAFLADMLATYRPRVDWVFLQFHRPLWSSGIGHGSNEGDTLRAADLIGIIDDAPVDFVFSGHDHDYERFDPSRGGYGGRPRIINPLPPPGYDDGEADGVVHIVTGGAGSFTNLAMFCRVDGCRVASGHLHYITLEIEPLAVRGTVRDMGPILSIADAYLRPTPVDTFTIRHAASVCHEPVPDEEPEAVEPLPEPVDTYTDPTEDPVEDVVPADVPPDSAADVPEDSSHPDPGDGTVQDRGCGCATVR